VSHAKLKVFAADSAQVLEDRQHVSWFSGWKRPAVKLPWRRSVLESDITTYGSRGIRHITSFAVYIDADYRQRFGELGLDAVRQVERLLRTGHTDVVDADLSGYFEMAS